MANLKELRGRIKSVASIAQITRAMEMVASMKLRKVQAKAMTFHPYTSELRSMIERLAAKVGEPSGSPFFRAREPRGRADVAAHREEVDRRAAEEVRRGRPEVPRRVPGLIATLH